jgi:hypothetical protein
MLALCRERAEGTGLSPSLSFRNELLLMLARVGFTDVEVRAGCSDAPATAVDTTMVFVARKAD